MSAQFDYRELLPPWNASFPEQLARVLEDQILIPKGLDRCNYSTSSFLTSVIKKPQFNTLECTLSERIEFLSPQICSRFQSVGLRFRIASEPAFSELGELFLHVGTLFEGDKSLCASVNSFVRAVHIIESSGPDYDCSFSDPDIPFSIFVSIPKHNGRWRELRVFEAVLHECMHLQLSAFELQMPIVRSDCGETLSYSPWKKSMRKAQGILHGMYVFHVIEYAYSILLDSGMLAPDEMVFVQRRLCEIANELEEVRGIRESLDLSPAGLGLAQMILEPSVMQL